MTSSSSPLLLPTEGHTLAIIHFRARRTFLDELLSETQNNLELFKNECLVAKEQENCSLSPDTTLIAAVNQDSLTFLSALHPMLQTLVLGVADVYTHRLMEMNFMLQNEHAIRLKTTRAIILILRVVSSSIKQSVSESSIYAYAQIEKEIKQAYNISVPTGIQLENHLLNIISDAATTLCTLKDENAQSLLTTTSFKRIPEPLPWAHLQKRLDEWSSWVARYRHIMNASFASKEGTMITNGVALSKKLQDISKNLQNIQTTQATTQIFSNSNADNEENDVKSDATIDWKISVTEAYRAASIKSSAFKTPRIVWILSRLRLERKNADETMNFLRTTLLAQAHTQIRLQIQQLEHDEKAWFLKSELQRATFLRGSIHGERAFELELRSATAGNDYMWRTVQRVVATIEKSYELGLKKEECLAMAKQIDVLTRLSSSILT
jgi:hypothetical protein